MRGETHVVRMLLVVLAVGCFAVGARAQVPRILVARTATFSTNPVGSALNELGLMFTTVVTFEDLLFELRRQQWDLVSIRGKNPFSIELEGQILDELEAHVARGGALHFQMSRLDEVRTPRYYELLGLDGVVDLDTPLRPLEAVVPAQHPSMPFRGLPVGDDPSPDYGDELVPMAGSRAIVRFAGDGDCTVVSTGGRVIANGLEWDNWAFGPGAGQTMVREQLRWLLRCPPDVDLDGALTFNDFRVFQNLFGAGDPSVDFDGDGALTVFDFLLFFNQFDAGC